MMHHVFNYKSWADERIIQAIESIDTDACQENYDFSLQQINHIVIVEELFRSRLEGTAEPHKETNSEIVPELIELKRRLYESGKWYRDYISSLDSKKIKEKLSFTFKDGKRGAMSIEEILFHIVNHASYHRGSIAHCLDLAGVAHPPDGYGIYIHEHEPERRTNA